jgi:hypothetical protein
VLPLPAQFHTLAMRWQAETGEPGSLVAGYFLGPGPGQLSTFSPGRIIPASDAFNLLAETQAPQRQPQQIALIRSDLAYWRPAAVVAVIGRRAPVPPALTVLFGRPAFRVGQVVAWRYRGS